MSTAVIPHPPRTMMEVFKSLPEGTRVQLIENNIVMSPAPKYQHQEILGDIFFRLKKLVTEQNLGKVAVAPVDVFFNSDNAYQPDIIFVSNERLSIIEEDGLHGAPDLIIEILSAATAKYDLGQKKDIYERYGVREYWTVNPKTREVHGFYLRNNLFEEIETEPGKISSKLLETEFSF